MKKRKTGVAPGTVVFTGKRKVDHIHIHYSEYNHEKYHSEEKSNQNLQSIYQPTDEVVQWYDIRGVHDTEIIEQIGNIFQIHPLALEEIADVHQRPKYEEYPSGIFIALNGLYIENEVLRKEYLSIYFGDGFVISFQESESDIFKSIRDRIKSKRGRVRNRGADYLAYALVDSIIDNYFVLVDYYTDIINVTEDEIMEEPREKNKATIHSLKSESLKLKRTIYPLREAISRFSKSDHPLVQEGNLLFIRDAYENIVQVMDMIESNRDLIYSLHDLYTSEISLRMNKVMHLLTIITTIFVPLSFLVGVYGMNFEYIPELKWENGYFYLWTLMISISVLSLIIFRKKKWL